MASYYKTKNLLGNRDVYNRYYGDFRGVDFSSDHTQVAESRLAYSVNMFKDYQSGQGKALETIPGFRRRVVLPNDEKIYAIHEFRHKDSDGTLKTKILIHAGKNLYLWHNYPHTIGVQMNETIILEDAISVSDEVSTFTVDLSKLTVHEITSIISNGKTMLLHEYVLNEKKLTIKSSTLKKGDVVYLTYTEGALGSPIFNEMNEQKSTSFIFNNRLYLIDGNNYIYYDGGNTVKKVVSDEAYVPTTCKGIVLSGENAGKTQQYEQANFLQPKFINTFVPDGLTSKYPLYDKGIESGSVTVEVYGVEKTEGTEFDVDYDESKIIFKDGHVPPVHPDIAAERNALFDNEILILGDYTEKDGIRTFSIDLSRLTIYKIEKVSLSNGDTLSTTSYTYENKTLAITSSTLKKGDTVYLAYLKANINGNSNTTDIANAKKNPLYSDGVKITAKKADYTDTLSEIPKCTLAAIFDERVFLSGNPDYPNRVYWCGINSVAGASDPSYFPQPFWQNDGVGTTGVTGMLVVADTLLVLKGDTQQDGSVYYHTASATGDNLYVKTYPSFRGLAGIGSVSGACVNFLDDPVFVSRLGLEGVSQLKIASERVIEHRSSLVDAKLANLDLSNACLEEWNGYLLLLVDGKIFMADSRQRYTHETGVMQYEWYYLEDIGVYDGQYMEYRYSPDVELEGIKDYRIIFCPVCKAPECMCNSDKNELTLEIAEANLAGSVANPPDEKGKAMRKVYTEYSEDLNLYISYVVHEYEGEYKALLCETRENYTGGTFKAAKLVKNLDNNVFFATDNGVICSFNFDKRNEDGEIPIQYYSFDERTIHCGCATKMDNCGIPHLTKNTVKKSTVIKTKTYQSSAAKIKVRTNKKPYNQIARINSTLFSFDNMDFSDFSFETTEQSLFAVKEKEKQWVEKQYYIYSDEYLKPFALYYVSYRYNIAGRFKE